MEGGIGSPCLYAREGRGIVKEPNRLAEKFA